jgi:phosphoglycolate phosphatase
MQRTLILDLDGTLVDSVPDLAAALNRLMAARDLAGFTRPQVAAMVGDGARALVDRAFTARSRPADAAALDDFLLDYTAHAADLTQPYPGVVATLDALAAEGWTLAVCTNKPEKAARKLLDALGLAPRFAAIGGGDSYPVRKPDPAHLLATLAAAGGTTAAAVMAGDHHNDIAAAHGAGIPCIFAAWGYGPADTGAHADATAHGFTDVPALAARLLAHRLPAARLPAG